MTIQVYFKSFDPKCLGSEVFQIFQTLEIHIPNDIACAWKSNLNTKFIYVFPLPCTRSLMVILHSIFSVPMF